MKKILIDFDSTIANSAECIIKKIFNLNWRQEDLEWDFKPYYEKIGKTKMDFIGKFNTPEFWSNLDITEGFIDWLNSQKASNIPIYICSHRNANDFTSLIQWCKLKGIDDFITDYIFIHKTFDKSIFIDNDTVIIDDKPDCFIKAECGRKILFGNYKYATDFLKNIQTVNIEKVKDWKSMPIIN